MSLLLNSWLFKSSPSLNICYYDIFFSFFRWGNFKQNYHRIVMIKALSTQVNIFKTFNLYTNSTHHDFRSKLWSRYLFIGNVLNQSWVPSQKSGVHSHCAHLLSPFVMEQLYCSRLRVSRDEWDRNNFCVEVYSRQE